MNGFAIILFAALATANAGILPGARILQGPSTRTTVVGPDGSSISAVAPGGQIVHEQHPGAVAYAAPIVAAAPAILAHSAPFVSTHHYLVRRSAPLFAAYSAPIVSHAVAPVSVGARSTVSEQSSVISHGGQVETTHVAAPVAVAHAAPLAVAHAAPVVSHAVAPVAVGARSTLSEQSSVISHGGQVETTHVAAPVAYAHAAPLLAHSTHVVAHAAPLAYAHAAPYVAHAAPVVAHSAHLVAHAAPVAVAHAAPLALAHSGVAAAW